MKVKILLLAGITFLSILIAGYTEKVSAASKNYEPQTYSTTFVLVHGAWHGAWCWDKLVPILRAGGAKVVTIDYPGHGDDHSTLAYQSTDTYVAKVIEAIDREPGKVVLVGHSLGGSIISNVAENRPQKIQSLVYLSAALLQDGQNYNDMSLANVDWYSSEGFTLPSADKKSVIVKPTAAPMFYNGCSASDVEFAVAHLGGEAIAALEGRVHITQKNYGRVPRFYIKTLQDLAILPALQDKMIAATPVQKVYSLNTGHSSFLSDPEGLARILFEIAQQ